MNELNGSLSCIDIICVAEVPLGGLPRPGSTAGPHSSGAYTIFPCLPAKLDKALKLEIWRRMGGSCLTYRLAGALVAFTSLQ